MIKPVIEGGAVTVNGPHPGLTTGAGGASGNTTAFIVVSWHTGSVLTVPAVVVPQSEERRYLTFIVQQPGVFISKLFTWFKLVL